MGPQLETLYLLGDLGNLSLLLVLLGAALLLERILHLNESGTLHEREAEFLRQFAGRPDNRAGTSPHVAGEAAPPPACAPTAHDDRSTCGSVSECYGYTPAALPLETDPYPDPADRCSPETSSAVMAGQGRAA